MPDEADTHPCYFCGKEVERATTFCTGCGKHVCKDCRENSDIPAGPHKVTIHRPSWQSPA
jgi:predicted amidophosphoribosyltransferase